MRRFLSQGPLGGLRSWANQKPCASWNRAWWLGAWSSLVTKLACRPTVKSGEKVGGCPPAWTMIFLVDGVSVRVDSPGPVTADTAARQAPFSCALVSSHDGREPDWALRWAS